MLEYGRPHFTPPEDISEEDQLHTALAEARNRFSFGSTNGDLLDWLCSWIRTGEATSRTVLETFVMAELRLSRKDVRAMFDKREGKQ